MAAKLLQAILSHFWTVVRNAGYSIWTVTCNTTHSIWTIFVNAPYVLYQDPLFQTGNTYLDGFLTFCFYLWTSTAIADILIFFSQKVQKARAAEARGSRGIHWKAFKAFILAAIVITLLVNLLRYEHRQLKLQFYTLLGGRGRIKGWEVVEPQIKAYVPDFLKGLVDTGLGPHFYSKVPRKLAEKFPWMPADSSRITSVWGYFKMLVDSGRNLWWTRQWFLGWVAWSIFVRVECEF